MDSAKPSDYKMQEMIMSSTRTSVPCVPEVQTVSFATLGCKTNQFESASMQETLQAAGYSVIPFEEGADLVIVNTCTVTSATDAQSRNLIRRARRFNATCRVVVTGCYAQIDPEALHDLPGVSLVIGNEEKQRLLDFLKKKNGEPTNIEVSDIRPGAKYLPAASDLICRPQPGVCPDPERLRRLLQLLHHPLCPGCQSFSAPR